MASNIEQWRPIIEYEMFYEVSNLGKIRSIDRFCKHSRGGLRFISGQIIKPKKIWSGYLSVCLSKNGIYKSYSVHRIVAKAWIENNDKTKNQVNHKNGIKTDNNINNLEWCTGSENTKHSYEILKRKPTKFWLGKFGKNHTNSISIIQKDLKGNFINKYDSSATAARILGLNEDSISRASRKERKTAYNFIWDRMVKNV